MEVGAVQDWEREKYWDDLSGKPLIPELVKKARLEELGELAKHKVYEEVPLDECWKATGQPPIGTRWVDVNKGDDQNPDYRSRLVAQEINNQKREDLFAATPPLEAKKILMSLAVTEGVGYQRGNKEKGQKLDFIDVRRAYFHAPARRLVYVKLPPEEEKEGTCGRLLKALYGTRDAAQNWEHAYIDFMKESGFANGAASPCVFYHRERNIRAVVHGDDFTILGQERQLDWFRERIAAKFEVKFRGRLGPAATDDKAIRILNRVVTWTAEGLEYEADQRHAEIIVDHLGLATSAKAVTTPSTKRGSEDSPVLSQEEATKYRALVARANYLAQDRVDIGYPVKELCRKMSKPTTADWEALKRLGRYLIDKTRSVIGFPYQGEPDALEVYVDTDHAGCLETRKSTSGGVIMHGCHGIKTWSATQQVIALSSGEAEYYGMVKGAGNALGLAGVFRDMGIKHGIVLYTDSSAAKGISSRRGLGKLRHVELNELWLQDQVSRGRVAVRKIKGEDNFSDSLTKHSSPDRIRQTMMGTLQKIVPGRHPIMPEVAQ